MNKGLQLVQSGNDPIGYLAENFRTYQANGSQYFFGISGRPTLDVSLGCPVGIFPSPDGNVYVDIDANDSDLKNFNVIQHGNTIVVEQKPSGAVNNIGGINIVGGSFGNVIIGNRNVINNGQNVCMDGSTARKTRQPKVRIFAPEGSDLDANMSGVGVLASAIALNDAEVDVSGQSFVALAARNLYFDLSGQATSTIIIGGGDLNIDASGQGSVNAQGHFNSVKVDLSGMGSLTTSGVCSGNYKASVSGMGSINHNGQINGRVKKSVSGMGSINI